MSLRGLLPDRLASQLMALLIGALLLAFLLSTAIIVVSQRRAGDSARAAVAADRAVELVVALDAISPEGQAEFARAASTRTTRIDVTAAPFVKETADNELSRTLATQIAGETERDARVSILSRVETAPSDDPRNAGRNREVVVISLPLASGERWLNFTTQEPLTWHTSADQRFLLISMGIMSLAVAAMVWLFIRRLTRPLTELADAARRTARGDHSVRVSETGPAELRNASMAFNVMQAEIARFDAERTRTIAAVGHDLRTPMTSLRIRAEMIEDDDLREPMIDTLDQMAAMAEGLISYARDGREEDRVPALDLAALLARVCEERGVAFKSDALPQIQAGPISLARAVGNLIDNAVRYGGAEGTTVTLSQTETAVDITVADTGPGIPESLFPTIFDPFTRGEGSRNADSGGAGLGLSIARRIVRAHSGELSLENRTPQGVSATIRLPISRL
ncbi:ATP-binding protein [Tropicimonas aquimaris]|uniref:histidine kinase n=1 Tax=Tropicimonas aquimaris TaxID=914152 RepID=A0ABW3IQS2_9RHOB